MPRGDADSRIERWYVMRRLILALGAIIPGILFAEEGRSILIDEVLIFGAKNPPAVLDSTRGWMNVGTVDLRTNALGAPGDRVRRRWRVKSVYEHPRSGGAAALQLRIRDNSADAVFTHPWSERADRGAESYSNWYEEMGEAVELENLRVIEARLVAPPRTPLTATLYTVTIEAWDRLPADEAVQPVYPDIQLAYARPLPREDGADAPDDSSAWADPNEAMSFALSFVEAALTGDLAGYYRSQADPLRSLDDGGAMARYRRAPPAAMRGVDSIEEYKRRFDYRVYDADTFSELFPEWFDASRAWTPGRDTYLFMGNRSRLGERIPEEVDFLTFLVGRDEFGEWKVIARPIQD